MWPDSPAPPPDRHITLDQGLLLQFCFASASSHPALWGVHRAFDPQCFFCLKLKFQMPMEMKVVQNHRRRRIKGISDGFFPKSGFITEGKEFLLLFAVSLGSERKSWFAGGSGH